MEPGKKKTLDEKMGEYYAKKEEKPEKTLDEKIHEYYAKEEEKPEKTLNDEIGEYYKSGANLGDPLADTGSSQFARQFCNQQLFLRFHQQHGR